MQQNLKLKKADIVLAIVFVMIAGAIFAWSAMYFTDSGNTVTIMADGNKLGEYALAKNAIIVVKDREIAGTLSGSELEGYLEVLDVSSADDVKAFEKVIDEYLDGLLGDTQYDGDVNVAVISGSRSYMDRAGCDNQHCVQHTKISRGNEQIVCLPNKVIVQITDDGESEIDTVAN